MNIEGLAPRERIQIEIGLGIQQIAWKKAWNQGGQGKRDVASDRRESLGGGGGQYRGQRPELGRMGAESSLGL